MIPWETCVEHRLNWEFYDRLTTLSTPLSRILQGMMQLAESMLRGTEPLPKREHHPLESYKHRATQFLLPDIYACIVLLNTDVVKRHQYYDIAIELEGRHSRGGCYLDWFAKESDNLKNVQVILSIHESILEKELMRTLRLLENH